MLFEFFSWWYVRGWLEAFRTARNWVSKVERNFSTGILFRTLFSPWKQITSGGGITPGDKLRTMIDNLMSRVIGFFVRLIVLITALLLMVLAGAAGLVAAVAWPLIPVAWVYLLFRGIAG